MAQRLLLKPWFYRAVISAQMVCAGTVIAACAGDEGQTARNFEREMDSGTRESGNDDVADDEKAPADDSEDPVTKPTDPMDPDAGGVSEPVPDECKGLRDKTACGESGVCLNEVCTPSRCGDGVVDDAIGEECEDNNEVSGDGCTLCRFDCSEDADCDDGLICTGAETCAAATHTCSSGAAPEMGVACVQANADPGVCRSGDCVAAGCGNGIMDKGEDCDDANPLDADGCDSDCSFTCASDDDCSNRNACDGVETCDLTAHTCNAGKPISCKAEGCDGTCQPEDGSCVYADADKDGSGCNADCNDADPAMLPGGFECKDGKDNDCDVVTKDSSGPGCECYPDADGDGFASSASGAVASAGACPSGYTRVLPNDATNTDCKESNASVFPGQTEYFPSGYCSIKLCFVGQANNFDYNCDGEAKSSYWDGKLAAATCAGSTRSCTTRSGWVGKEIPACGATGIFRSCSVKDGVCQGVDTPSRTRPCR